jgi:hypothetical protein
MIERTISAQIWRLTMSLLGQVESGEEQDVEADRAVEGVGRERQTGLAATRRWLWRRARAGELRRIQCLSTPYITTRSDPDARTYGSCR